ncbi:MAG: CapA family protein, partial [Clostridia bacterium]|nr:CapA family protein [Clostridia bacterium]
FDPFITMQDIRTAKKNADNVIVLYQGGKEHCRYPSPILRNLCREMVYCGADVVVAQHSHCIGCYEQFEGGHIVYGQGNLHFCMPEKIDELWNTSLLVSLDINDTVNIRFIPIITESTSIRLAKGKEYDDIMTPFAQRNEELKNGKWKAGWLAFCDSVSEQYKSILFGEKASKDPQVKEQRLAHYLDCEAHLDVLLEIYPTWNQTNEK